MTVSPSRPEARSRSSGRFFHTRTVAWARARISKEGLRRYSRIAQLTTSMGSIATAVDTAWRPHDSRCADGLGRVKAVAARSAGARSASLDAAQSISDLAATRSQLLIPRECLRDLV